MRHDSYGCDIHNRGSSRRIFIRVSTSRDASPALRIGMEVTHPTEAIAGPIGCLKELCGRIFCFCFVIISEQNGTSFLNIVIVVVIHVDGHRHCCCCSCHPCTRNQTLGLR
jgi:hypothetical protein